MKDLIRLTRPLNLLIVALTMVVMRYEVIYREMRSEAVLRALYGGLASIICETYDPRLQLGPWAFALLVLSTVLIMAGGNVINDYFDTRIDRVNKPADVLVGRSVKRRVAMAAHWILSGTGLVLGVLVAVIAHQRWLALIPAFAIGALWWYSTTAKRQLFIGNGLVATLSALVVLQVGLYDIRMLEIAYSGVATLSFSALWCWILGYSAFAFVSSLLRELQKDMADVRGDAAAGCRTVPIVWGMKAARLLAAFWTLVLIVAVGLLADRIFTETAARVYLYLLVIVPILASCILTWNARNRDQHNRAGHVMKLAMVFAVAFAAV